MRLDLKIKITILGLVIFFISFALSWQNYCSDQADDRLDLEINTPTQMQTANGDWNYYITKPIGHYSFSVFIEDVNNDGFNDMVTTNYETDDISIYLWNETFRDWDSQIRKTVGQGPYNVYVADANNDGYNDIVTVPANSDEISILIWNNSINDWDTPITLNGGTNLYNVFVGDADNDGNNDIVITNYDFNGQIRIFCWNALNENWDDPIVKNVGRFPTGLYIGDVNNNGFNDIAVCNELDYNISILCWNTYTTTWDAPFTLAAGDGPEAIFIADLNSDGFNDIVVSNYGADDVSIILWNPISGGWNSQIKRYIGNGPTGIFVEDANNDGFKDIATAIYKEDSIAILLWDSNSDNWTLPIKKSVGSFPWSICIGDVDNDGYNDIVTANSESDDISIYLWYFFPEISIEYPEFGSVYGEFSPPYQISVNGSNLVSIWYTLDDGKTNITCEKLVGIINQTAWQNITEGHITLKFYVRNRRNQIDSDEIIIVKDIIEVISNPSSSSSSNDSDKNSNKEDSSLDIGDYLFSPVGLTIGGGIGLLTAISISQYIKKKGF